MSSIKLLFCGPDGAGKSALSDALRAALSSRGFEPVVVHHRPNILFRRPVGGGPVVEPHALPSRGVAVSLIKIGAIFLDFLALSVSGARRARRVVIFERGWCDLMVDPRRYRLDSRTAPLVRFLAPPLKATVAIMLVGDAEVIHARKPELSIQEITRQIVVWQKLSAIAAKRTIVVNTTEKTLKESEAEVVALLGSGRV